MTDGKCGGREGPQKKDICTMTTTTAILWTGHTPEKVIMGKYLYTRDANDLKLCTWVPVIRVL